VAVDELLRKLLEAGYEVTFSKGTRFGYYAELREPGGQAVSTYIGETPREALDGVVPVEMRAA
jgi:hypothetical protein